MTKAQKIKAINQALREALGRGRRKVEAAERVYADGTISFDATLKGRGQHDLRDQHPLADVPSKAWPADGAMDLWIYQWEGSYGGWELLTNADALFEGGRFVGLRVLG